MNTNTVILALALSVGVGHSQIRGTATIVNAPLGKHLKVSTWLVTLESQSPDSVLVVEEAVLRKTANLQPIDSDTLAQLVQDAQRYSTLESIVRGLGDAATVAGWLGAGGPSHQVLPISNGWAIGLSSATFVIPYAIGRLKGLEIPVAQRVAALSWKPILLAPGGYAKGHIFTAPWKQLSPSYQFDFVLETNKAQNVRLAQ